MKYQLHIIIFALFRIILNKGIKSCAYDLKKQSSWKGAGTNHKMSKQVSIEVELGEVQETLLIPLFARAEESVKNGILKDPMAEKIVSKLAYDFQKMKNKPSLKGAVLRTLAYDQLVLDLIKKHPEATIVELGCGLNTRFNRVDNGTILWYDLDMPDVHELWLKFFTESERRTFLPHSAFDDAWISKVERKVDTPIIFIAEASTIYFNEADNKQLFSYLTSHFTNSYFIVDTATDYFVKRQDKHDVLKMYSARVKWVVNDPRQIENWDERIKLLKEVNFFRNPTRNLKSVLPWYYNLIIFAIKLFNKKAINQYQINLFAIK